MRSNIKHLRREPLIGATIDTIAKHGFRKTPLSQVAKRAKLSQGIVNFYFKTKGGRLLETLEFLAEAPPEGTLAQCNQELGGACNELQRLDQMEARAGIEPTYEDLQSRMSAFSNPLTLT